MPDTEVATVLMDNKDGETKTVKDLSPEKEKKEVTSPKKDASTEPDEEIENAVSTEKKEDKDNGLSEIEFVKEARNRVKLYVLCDQRVWDDRGTGHVTCVSVPDQPSVHCIIVRLESNEKNVLESKILMETAYQKQQETLIVWSESDSCDLALSFQEKSGCEEIWAKICEAQGRDPEEGSYDDMEEGEVSDVGQAGTSGSSSARRAARGGTVQLPPCEVSRLPEIELLLSNHTQTPALREKMASAIENENFVPKLCELFRMCEDLDNVEGLHTLFNIAKHLFHLNRNSIIDILFAEENEKDVLGMLEYDPSVTEPRRHREFLFEKTKFNDVLKIEKEELRERIRHANHVQYVQDVCFPAPSIFEENLLSVLNSHLFFCRVEIVGMLLDEKTLKVLFTQLRDPETPVGRRSDLAKFLKEFCSFSQALQNTGTNSRESFFKTLMMNDVLGTIEPCIRSPDHETRTTIVEILLMMVEYNPQTVRDYLLRQAKDRPEDEILLNLLIKHMLTDRDAELSSADQVSQVLRTLLDPDNMVPHKNDRSEFLSFFYKKCMNTLLKPIIDNVQGGKVNKEDYYTSNVCCLVLRLLCFCVEHHAYNMRSCCLTNGLINKVLVLLQCRHHFLALSALKMIRGVVGLKDDFYCRDIVKHGALDKVVDCFLANGPRYNLLNSAIIELFEYVRQEDMKLLIRYTMEKHWPVFKKVKYVKTFQQLRMKYEQLLDNERPDSDRDSERDSDSKLSKEKLIDNEESWFSNDDDEPPSTPTEVIEAIPGPARKQGAEPAYPSVLRSKVDDDDEDSVFTGGASVLKRRSPTTIKIVRPLGSASPSENSSSSSSSSENSRSPSPSSRRSPEDEVSSSQPGSKESSPQAQSTALKTLSEYGDSDSDPDEESPENGEREDDVTSTSGTKRRRTESPPPEGGGVKRPRSESPPLTAVAELKVGGAEGKQGAEHA